MKRKGMNTFCAVILTGVLIAGGNPILASQELVPDEAVEQTMDAPEDAASEDAAPEDAASEDAAPEDAALTSDEEEIARKAAGGHPWIDSQAKENIYEGMPLSPKDDFNLYVNYDFMMRMKNGEKPAASENIILQEVKAFLEDDTSNSHEEELVQTYYKAYTDWETRNKLGLEPLRPVVEDIHGISSFDELNEFLCDPDRSGVVPGLLRVMKYIYAGDPTHYAPGLYFRGWLDALLKDPDAYENPDEKANLKLAAAKKEIVHDLTELGWSEEEAEQAFEDHHAVETALAPAMPSFLELSLGQLKEVLSDISEIQEWVKEYPISEILADRGYTGGAYVQACEAYMKALGDFYTEDHLELLKNYHIVSFLLTYDWYCDEDSFLLSDQTSGMDGPDDYKKSEDIEGVFYNLLMEMGDALTKAYVGRYDMSQEKKDMQVLFDEIRGVYRDMLAEAEWLSEETRAKAIEKLDAMQFFALYPDQFKDYSALDFKGKSMAEIQMALNRFNDQDIAASCRDEIVPEVYAFETMPTLAENACALPWINGFMFSIGITKTTGYNSDMRIEDLYGMIGYVFGHEMSHCFDENGSEFDKNGFEANWWTPEDKAAFDQRLQKLIDYFDNITVFEGVNCDGDMVSAEATADITGMQAILKVASTKEGFDYDRFFRKYAESYASDSSYKRDLYILGDDPHPLAYLRTNVVVQQFDEFMETYDVKEGDGMYLAPEDRILIW